MRGQTIKTDGRKFLLDALKLVGTGKHDDNDDDDDDDNSIPLFKC
jgi:hypothetical protein